MKFILSVLTTLLSLNSWAAGAVRSPTPSFLPAGVCSFKTKSFLIPKTDIRISQLEVFTGRRGTGCLRGETHNFWHKCDIRANETEEGSEPEIVVALQFRDAKTLRDAGQMTIPMTDIVKLGWITDRKGNPQAIFETTKRENVEIKGTTLHILAKRDVKDLKENKIATEVSFYLPGNKEKKIKSQLLYRAHCESEFTNKDY